MKKLVLLTTFAVAGVAATVNAKNSLATNVFKFIDKSCSWCISANGNTYCATAATCAKAKAMAQDMADNDL